MLWSMQVLGFPCVPLRVGGQQIEVGIDTLLLNTPEGSYFRGLLRQYGVDGETDARVQLEDAIRRLAAACLAPHHLQNTYSHAIM